MRAAKLAIAIAVALIAISAPAEDRFEKTFSRTLTYRGGRVPQPGIILLGRVTDDVSIFDRPGPVTVRVERIK